MGSFAVMGRVDFFGTCLVCERVFCYNTERVLPYTVGGCPSSEGLPSARKKGGCANGYI